MPPRRPRREPFAATCDNLREMASAYLPSLRFAKDELFYPIRAESWLTHTTAADWPETEGQHGDDLVVDTLRRGTAVVQADSEVTMLRPRAGTPPYERPVSLEPSADDPNSIFRYRHVGADTFLVFGGWADSTERTLGNHDYLRWVFSELGAAINPSGTWEPVELGGSFGPHLPHMFVRQPVTPTVYAEFEWAGMFPTWCRELGGSEFCTEVGGAHLSALDGYLCLTYYYLYPLRHPAQAGSAPTQLEGQWEAASLFFPGEASGQVQANGRPTELMLSEPPAFIVISQNLESGIYRSRVAKWSDVRKLPAISDTITTAVVRPPDSTACILFVGLGTHAFHFEPQQGHEWADEPAPGSELDLSLDEDVFWPRLGATIFWFFVAPAIAVVVMVAIGVALISLLGPVGVAIVVVLAIVAFVVMLILALLSLFGLLSDEGSDTKPEPRNEEATGDGPEAGGSPEPPAGDPHGDVATDAAAGAGGATPAFGVPAGTPNAGSPTGCNTVSFDLRVVDVLNHADDYTGFPPAEKCEHPAWWAYTGGWGVRVPPRLSSGWSSGMQRVDTRHRSWAYYHAAALARQLDMD